MASLKLSLRLFCVINFLREVYKEIQPTHTLKRSENNCTGDRVDRRL